MTSRQCIDCSRTIPNLRLTNVKNVIRCITCQTKYEKSHDTRLNIADLKNDFSWKKPVTSKAKKMSKK